MVSLVVSRKSLYKLAKRHVAALWRAVDADASGSVEREEVERFVLDDAPEAGEHEFAVVLEALRRRLGRRSIPLIRCAGGPGL